MVKLRRYRADLIMIIIFSVLCVALALVPGWRGTKADPAAAVRCRGEVLEVNNSGVVRQGVVTIGYQKLELKLLDGKFKGRTVEATNELLGRLDLDKIFEKGDTALVVVSLSPEGRILYVNAQDHYRLNWEIALFALFAVLLIAFGGLTGFKAIISFIFSCLIIWKAVIPLSLDGYDPVLLALGALAVLTGAIIFLVAGLNAKGLTAFAGAFLGVLTSCGLAVWFTGTLRLHGAVMPFAETLLYSGFAHLDLAKLYAAAVFFASSGAVMDLAVDVAAGMQEVIREKPDISRRELCMCGIRVGRAVVGTMTTTLLLAYSGGYLTMIMAFMAQGVPAVNFFNYLFVAAEVLKTLVGSLGLILVAPFTAIVGGFIFKTAQKRKIRRGSASA
ncbi:YibE/F family protein [Lentisphaerota bacterium ZTH]|nr:YibE/F family protein [Lentisphaerota bacterium]WET05511.1 YibE/F family protein [Lentisphaerota bacterium ZTH]